jgi:gluconate 2-dehydrogenase gamma chain
MLTDHQWTVLTAAVDHIIPADEWPGGWEAGVGDYLRRQFAGSLAGALPLYQAGLDALDAEAKAGGKTGFTDMAPPAQDELLARVERGDVVTDWLVDPKTFFTAVVTHAMEGYYADPGNGGNHSGVSWDMIGFEVRA